MESEEDRFNSAILGVQNTYRDDANKTQNAIFLTKLNYICRNYDTTH